MAKRFLKYETEVENGMVDENGCLKTGICIYENNKEIYWDVECTQKLTASDMISLGDKVHSVIIIGTNGPAITYSTCNSVRKDNHSVTLYGNDAQYSVYF